VEPPRFDLFALGLWIFECLGHGGRHFVLF
jgi:hypothetical protein